MRLSSFYFFIPLEWFLFCPTITVFSSTSISRYSMPTINTSWCPSIIRRLVVWLSSGCSLFMPTLPLESPRLMQHISTIPRDHSYTASASGTAQTCKSKGTDEWFREWMVVKVVDSQTNRWLQELSIDGLLYNWLLIMDKMKVSLTNLIIWLHYSHNREVTSILNFRKLYINCHLPFLG